jgi:hypothetical protein
MRMDEDDKKIPGKRRRRCDCCGKLKYGVEKIINPYNQDLYGEEIKEVLCPSCIQNMVDDI